MEAYSLGAYSLGAYSLGANNLGLPIPGPNNALTRSKEKL